MAYTYGQARDAPRRHIREAIMTEYHPDSVVERRLEQLDILTRAGRMTLEQYAHEVAALAQWYADQSEMDAQ